MIQTQNMSTGKPFDIDTLGTSVRRALERLTPGSAKIFGSALLGGGNDVDIAVRDTDTLTIAYLLNVSSALGMHPVVLPAPVYENLHDLLSWKNCCMTACARTGEVTYSRHFTEARDLEFNPASRLAFPDLPTVVKSAKKLEAKGFTIPESEKFRAQLHLNDCVSSLGDLARLALTERIVEIVAAFGGIVAGGFFRDEVDGRAPKDIDVFVPAGRDWNGLCFELSTWLEEIEFEKPEGKRVNLRKFRAKSRVPGYEMLVIDVIDYGFVHEGMHVVETFDFSCNTLWWEPGAFGVKGGFGRSAKQVVDDIRNRRLVVGDNMWYRAGLYRALKRWQRFRGDGYIADAENTQKYSKYVKLFQTAGVIS